MRRRRAQVDFGDVLERVEDENDGETTKATTTASDGRVDAKGSVNPFGGGAVAAVPAAGSIFGSLPTAPGSTFGAPCGGGGGLFGGGTAPGAGTAADDEDEDEPARPSSPSYQANEAVEDEKEVVLLRVGKVKFHTKKDAGDKNWADRGVNSFEFRREKAPSEGDVKRCRLLMRNTIGKAVLNAGLYPKMSSQLTEKKMKDGSAVQNGLIATVFNAEEENQKVMVYLRFGKESDAKELHKLISENVATL